jgi:hypothetical protein
MGEQAGRSRGNCERDMGTRVGYVVTRLEAIHRFRTMPTKAGQTDPESIIRNLE